MKKQKGFTLLVAIVTTSLLLLVSFAVVNVSLKQLILTYSGQESQYALYNAESGLECALYWDVSNGPVSAFFGSSPTDIQCNGQLNTVGGGGGGSANTYSYMVPITILHAKVPDTDGSGGELNFPVLICANGTGVCNTSVSGLNQTGIGAHVTDSNGYDINFFANSDCTGRLEWEMEKYVPSSGEIESWVKVSNLSSSVDKTIYMCYGNPSIVSDQSNRTAVWDSNFKGVWHLPNGGTLSGVDSTGNNVPTVNGAGATTGQIDGGGSFAISQYIDTANVAAIQLERTDSMTWSAWFKTSSASTMMLFEKKDGAATFRGYQLFMSSGNLWFSLSNDNSGAANELDISTNATYNNNAWHNITFTYTGTSLASGVASYVDGIPVAKTTQLNTLTGTIANNQALNIGRRRSTNVLNWNGSLDEIRISKGIARSADWIKTEYNNQSSPGTFEIFGSESSGSFGGGGAGVVTSNFQVNFQIGCAVVQVTKQPSGATAIESRGYNTCAAGASRKFERGISLTY
ncbi:MAG: DUF2341 domain-containing protein [Patescibacteria group bacterium]